MIKKSPEVRKPPAVLLGSSALFLDLLQALLPLGLALEHGSDHVLLVRPWDVPEPLERCCYGGGFSMFLYIFLCFYIFFYVFICFYFFKICFLHVFTHLESLESPNEHPNSWVCTR